MYFWNKKNNPIKLLAKIGNLDEVAYKEEVWSINKANTIHGPSKVAFK